MAPSNSAAIRTPPGLRELGGGAQSFTSSQFTSGGLYLSSLCGVTLMTHAKFEVIAKLIRCTREIQEKSKFDYKKGIPKYKEEHRGILFRGYSLGIPWVFRGYSWQKEAEPSWQKPRNQATTPCSSLRN